MAADAARDSADDDLARAVGQYVLGERSLGNAARSVGLTRWEFEEVLRDAGFTGLYGPRSSQDLEDELETARDLE